MDLRKTDSFIRSVSFTLDVTTTVPPRALLHLATVMLTLRLLLKENRIPATVAVPIETPVEARLIKVPEAHLVMEATMRHREEATIGADTDKMVEIMAPLATTVVAGTLEEVEEGLIPAVGAVIQVAGEVAIRAGVADTVVDRRVAMVAGEVIMVRTDMPEVVAPISRLLRLQVVVGVGEVRAEVHLVVEEWVGKAVKEVVTGAVGTVVGVVVMAEEVAMEVEAAATAEVADIGRKLIVGALLRCHFKRANNYVHALWSKRNG